MRCDDGTEVSFSDGNDGADGTSCSIIETEDGLSEIVCGDAPSVVLPAEDRDCQIHGDFIIEEYRDLLLFFATGCTEITGDLIISSTDLTHLTGLESLEVIGGNLEMIATPALANIRGLQNLRSIGDLFILWGNGGLTDLGGLENIEFIGGNLVLWELNNLTDLTALRGISSLGGNLDIQDSATLTNLDGLENLKTIGGLRLRGNNTLATVDHLESIESVDGFFDIVQNPALPTCAAQALLDAIGEGNITGDISIQDNDDDGLCE